LEFKVKQDVYNALLKRKEVHVEVEHDGAGTPSRMDLRKAVATKYATKPENVYVIDIDTKTGTQKAICEVQVYDDPEAAHLVAKYLRTRNLPPEERKKVKEEEAKKEEAKPKPEKPKAEKPKAQTEKKEEPAKKAEVPEKAPKPETKPAPEQAKKPKES
jgi:small subunit ribosomal protein S24e